MSVRIFLCDDVPELRLLLRFALEEDPELQVVGEAGDAATALARLPELAPDVILLDLSMPGMDGLEAIPPLRERHPDCAIVVFSGFSAERMREPALGLGASAYVEKGTPLDEIRATVRAIAGAGAEGSV